MTSSISCLSRSHLEPQAHYKHQFTTHTITSTILQLRTDSLDTSAQSQLFQDPFQRQIQPSLASSEPSKASPPANIASVSIMADERSPTPLSAGDIPSSFDHDPDFFNEGRANKLWRKIKQEPLIPLGCLATCYALYMASQSIRQGDSVRTNKMFRARIYAQGFTLVAIVAGSFYYQDERMKRKGFEKAVEKKKALEKRDRWLAELEARDAEDRAWRDRIEKDSGEAVERVARAEQARSRFETKSVLGQVGVLARTREIWRRS